MSNVAPDWQRAMRCPVCDESLTAREAVKETRWPPAVPRDKQHMYRRNRTFYLRTCSNSHWFEQEGDTLRSTTPPTH